MHIDLKRLGAERDIDSFARAPIELMESLELNAGALRDSSLADPEITKQVGAALSRVTASSITPRMRQLLAIMNWVPMDPGTDNLWILDETVSLPPHANALVADATAKSYAEGMTVLFGPDDGSFAGGGWLIEDDGDSSVAGLRAKVRLIAERRWVAASIIARHCPATHLDHWIRKDVERINAGRFRCGLPLLTVPSIKTIQRWGRDFAAVHAHRAGIGKQWRNYRFD